MPLKTTLKARFAGLLLLVLGGLSAQAQQCALFKSEINDVKDFEITVGQLTDSLKVYAEAAAYAARFADGKDNAGKVEALAGQALAAAHEAVQFASEAQFHAEICGLDDVVTFSINAESAAIDARDFAEEAYQNAKKAGTVGKLGDLHFFMRKSLEAAREAGKSSEKAMYAAYDAFYSCTHKDTDAGKGEE
ncbi:hypothetical protein OZ410_03650 [Robiginitalea sp. M366]|uniref:hypothetical protein n=1 Tax=Robiginitalea aestuariiviva TaxID=3036903 RepID=UPI00240E4880|nr:hypothetical protein [Robiginitalea aestuariiviva]MDG1571395.1 hypothetical protein [Robiginitalea aestuariiviva]